MLTSNSEITRLWNNSYRSQTQDGDTGSGEKASVEHSIKMSYVFSTIWYWMNMWCRRKGKWIRCFQLKKWDRTISRNEKALRNNRIFLCVGVLIVKESPWPQWLKLEKLTLHFCFVVDIWDGSRRSVHMWQESPLLTGHVGAETWRDEWKGTRIPGKWTGIQEHRNSSWRHILPLWESTQGPGQAWAFKEVGKAVAEYAI